MNRYRIWAITVVAFFAVFVAYNYIVWKVWTEDILTDTHYYNGGLDRLGYIIGSKHYRNPEHTLPRRVIENYEYDGQHIDVLTIGDSFSNVKNNGKDPMYQDWISSLHQLNVLNVQPLEGAEVFATAIMLLNSGYLDKIKPRFVLLEFVERHCVDMFSHPMDFTRSMPLDDIERIYRTASYRYKLPNVGFINTGNFKVVRNSILYRYSDNAFSSNVYVKTLEKPFFSVQNGKRLLFYKDDIASIKNATPEAITLLNDNLNRLAELLAKKRIKLYFMPAADKYNMYSDYIENNQYPKSTFFEQLRRLKKKYRFVDTKALLQEEIRNGEQDIYYADDTHWSWKAVKKIVERMVFSALPSVDRSSQLTLAAPQLDA